MLLPGQSIRFDYGSIDAANRLPKTGPVKAARVLAIDENFLTANIERTETNATTVQIQLREYIADLQGDFAPFH